MSISIEQLRENYGKFHDVKLRQLVFYEFDQLTPLAQQVLLEEIDKRGLSELAEAAKLLPTIINEENLETTINRVHHGPCPICDRKEFKINGARLIKVKSFVFASWQTKSIRIGCSVCLDSLHKKYMLTTLVLGWWSLPDGLIRTLVALVSFRKRRSEFHYNYPNEYLRRFVRINLSHLSLAEGSKEETKVILQNDMLGF